MSFYEKEVLTHIGAFKEKFSSFISPFLVPPVLTFSKHHRTRITKKFHFAQARERNFNLVHVQKTKITMQTLPFSDVQDIDSTTYSATVPHLETFNLKNNQTASVNQ